MLRDPMRNLFWRLNGKRFPIHRWNTPPAGLIFVCKGNICRSPFAHHLAENMTAGCNPRFPISSAGLEVKRPLPPPPAALLAAEAFQIALNAHMSQALDAGMLKAGTAVVAMEAGQVVRLRQAFPRFRASILLLPLYDPENGKSTDVYNRYHLTDPYGKNPSTFLECYARIRRCLISMLSEWGMTAGEHSDANRS
jgi:protein-tyrosine phosphatase